MRGVKFLMKIDYPLEPEKFRELCERVGLALMMGQKVQYALAYYFSVYHMVNSGWSKEEAMRKVDFHLSKPMGVIVNSIEKSAPLDGALFKKVLRFKERRNWVAHDFDDESTQYIAKGERIDHYISEMSGIVSLALELVKALNNVGEELVPTGI